MKKRKNKKLDGMMSIVETYGHHDLQTDLNIDMLRKDRKDSLMNKKKNPMKKESNLNNSFDR